MSNYVALSQPANGSFVDISGDVLPGRSINIYLRGTTTLVTVYPNPDGSGTPLTQPLITDSNGQVPGYCASGQSIDYYDTATTIRKPGELLSASDFYGSSSALQLAANFDIYYLSTSGDDANSGIAPDRPLATLGQALTLAIAAGGARIVLGPGTFNLPTAGHSIATGNITIEGAGMDITTLLVTNPTSVGLKFDITNGTQLTNIHIRNLTIQLTGVATGDPQTQALNIGSVRNWTVDRVRCKGGWYPMQIGGHGNLPPAQDGWWTRSILDSMRYDNAITNAENVWVTDNTFTNPQAARPFIDVEPNGNTDSIRGLIISRNHFYGAPNYTGIALQWGTASDPNRMRGIQVIDNQFIDCANAINNNLPGAVIKGNVIRATQPYLAGFSTQYAIGIGRPSTMFSADGCIVEGNRIDSMSNANLFAPISLEGVSHCKVSGNVIQDDQNPSNAAYVVHEKQRYAAIVSGFQLGTPSGMTVPIGPGVLQKDATGVWPTYTPGALVSKTAQTATIAAASTYDRVDIIILDPVTGAVSVVQGAQPSTLWNPPPAPPHPAGSFVRVGYVYVHANEVSVAAGDVTDARIFVAHNNEIDQAPTAAPPQYGLVGLVNPSSSRRGRRIPPIRTDAYAKSVLSDAPLIYLPLSVPSGQLANDYGAYGTVAWFVGGVALNQQILATSRYGPHFDGSSGYVHIQRPDELFVNGPLCLQPFTLEMQILMDNNTSNYTFAAQGSVSGTNCDFRLFHAASGKVSLTLGATTSGMVSTGALSLTALNHVAADWDGTHLNYYINGVLDAGSPLTPTAPTYTGSGYQYRPILLGADAGSAIRPTQHWLPGFLRHFAIYAPNIGATRIGAHAALM